VGPAGFWPTPDARCPAEDEDGFGGFCTPAPEVGVPPLGCFMVPLRTLLMPTPLEAVTALEAPMVRAEDD